MSKWTIGGLILGGLAMICEFVGSTLSAQGERQEIIDELESKYVLVPRKEDEGEA